jgi:two-component system, LuxR family, response regulator FixJ
MALPSASVGETVIIVEDDPDLLQSLRFSLQLEGFTVRLCETAEALLAAAQLPATGCLVIDQILPGKSGVDLLCQLRAEGVRLPAIIITTNPGTWIRTRAIACEATIVEKPLLGSVLTEAIRRALAGGASSTTATQS